MGPKKASRHEPKTNTNSASRLASLIYEEGEGTRMTRKATTTHNDDDDDDGVVGVKVKGFIEGVGV
jgi:hypothetical protein